MVQGLWTYCQFQKQLRNKYFEPHFALCLSSTSAVTRYLFTTVRIIGMEGSTECSQGSLLSGFHEPCKHWIMESLNPRNIDIVTDADTFMSEYKISLFYSENWKVIFTLHKFILIRARHVEMIQQWNHRWVFCPLILVRTKNLLSLL